MQKTKLSVKSCESCIFYAELCDDPEIGFPCREYTEDCCGKQTVLVLETDHHMYFACQNPECANVTALEIREGEDEPVATAYG
jgi:hypothetical protein